MAAIRRSAAEQFTLILECRNSGLSDHQWCLEHNIKPGTFYNWVKRLRRKNSYCIPNPAKACSKEQPKQDIVPLRIIEDRSFEPDSIQESGYAPSARICRDIECALEITTKTGIGIRVNNSISPELFQILLNTIERPAC